LTGFEFTNGSRKFNRLRTAFLLEPVFHSMISNTRLPRELRLCWSPYVFNVFDVFDVLGPSGRTDILGCNFLGFLVDRLLY
jgi:hypothetical protein